MMTHETIIIGAGPAGLYAAYLLAQKGRKCLVLEARDRIGGRAYSIRTANAAVIETGAEFVHGKLPLSISLLQEAGLSYGPVSGQWVSLKGGLASPDEESSQWAAFMRRLGALEQDRTLREFLDAEFGGNDYAWLRDRAVSYAEGYDSADANRVSAKALFEEWHAEDPDQFRIDEGYSALMNYLAKRVAEAGSEIRRNTEVVRLEPVGNELVTVVMADGSELSAEKVIVAVPLGILQRGNLAIGPAPLELRSVFEKMGFGDVIKFALVFKEAFWDARFPGFSFLMSGADIPTWWTQAPKESTVLTGWLAGKTARIRAGLSDEMLRDMALNSLSILFSMEREVIESLLLELHVFNWSGDPFTGGAYAYETPESAEARKKLRELAPERISFIGEYEYAGPSMGTVEAAFNSAAAAVPDASDAAGNGNSGEA